MRRFDVPGLNVTVAVSWANATISLSRGPTARRFQELHVLVARGRRTPLDPERDCESLEVILGDGTERLVAQARAVGQSERREPREHIPIVRPSSQ